MRRPFIASVLMVLLPVVAAAACARPRPTTDSEPAAEAAAAGVSDEHRRVTLAVRSRHTQDVTIYLVNLSQRTRLGTVTSAGTATFRFPWAQLPQGGTIRLLADPVGGGTSFLSESLSLQPGQTIEWTLDTDLVRSSIRIR